MTEDIKNIVKKASETGCGFGATLGERCLDADLWIDGGSAHISQRALLAIEMQKTSFVGGKRRDINTPIKEHLDMLRVARKG